MNKAEMQEAVKWPERLLKTGARRGLGPPERDIDYIHGMIGDTVLPEEVEVLETHLPASVYSDYGIVAYILDLRMAASPRRASDYLADCRRR